MKLKNLEIVCQRTLIIFFNGDRFNGGSQYATGRFRVNEPGEAAFKGTRYRRRGKHHRVYPVGVALRRIPGESAPDGEQGIVAAQRIDPDVIILDIMLPGIDGLEVCRRLRSNPTTRDIPILMLTAMDEVRDRITGLRTGADDYLTKPFDFDELLERIRAILRRQKRAAQGGVGEEEGGSQILQFVDLPLNTATREVTRGDRQIELTATEYNLLHLFMSHPRQVLDRQTILNRVWGYDFLGETNIIEVYVRYLREKIED